MKVNATSTRENQPDSPTFVVRLTPPGRAAIASLLVSGPRAAEFVRAAFRPRGSRALRAATGELRCGAFGPPPSEEVVVFCRSDEAFEIHCHGGTAIVARIEGQLISLGATAQTWRDWTWSGRSDSAPVGCGAQRSAIIEADPLSRASIAAAARLALADAPTFRTSAILLEQLNGALAAEVEQIRTGLARGEVSAARDRAAHLIARAEFGLHLVRPWRIVIVGAPNAGKSSLLNALLGYSRAIVHSAPGTTRDLVTAMTAIDGWPVELVDTAGLRNASDAVEAEGVQRAAAAIAAADVVLAVTDRSRPPDENVSVASLTYPKMLRVRSKIDLPPAPGQEIEVAQDASGARGAPAAAGRAGDAVASAAARSASASAVSALTGEGIRELLSRIAAMLVPEAPLPGAGVPFSHEQVTALRALAAAFSPPVA